MDIPSQYLDEAIFPEYEEALRSFGQNKVSGKLFPFLFKPGDVEVDSNTPPSAYIVNEWAYKLRPKNEKWHIDFWRWRLKEGRLTKVRSELELSGQYS